ncbi:MAG: PAS-domain containing protein [Thiolinea sp.]
MSPSDPRALPTGQYPLQPAAPDNGWMLDALNHLDQGISIFDHDLRLVAWNQRMLELLELPPELAVPNESLEVFFRFNAERGEYGSGDIDTLVAERMELAQSFKPHVFERVRPDGTIIEVRGNPMDNGGFVTTYTDITEQRHAEARLEQRVIKRTEELRNSELWIRQIADAVPALIAYVDRDNRYQFINHMHEQWFGLDRAQLIGTSIFELVENRNLQQFRQDVRQVLRGQQVQSEYTLGRRGNTPLDVSISFIPHFDEQQHMLGYFFLGQDLTEYKQTQRELAESHKMQALGLLTGGVAHDFNNLLTIVLGNLNFLEDDDLTAGEIREAVTCCRQAAQRGSNLIQRLLTFSRRQALKPEVTCLNALVEDFYSLLQRSLGETVQIDCRLQPGLPPARLDRNQLETSLLNLALNARDAMPGGGLITISTQSLQLPGRQGQFSSLPAGAYVLLSVSDNGEGMSEETLSRVFEPFYTTKPAGLGTGLGLSMVYGFVKQSGGGIDIQSRPGQGTCIRLVFPQIPATREDDVPETQSTAENTPGAHILLVEDDEGVRHFVYRALCKLGYRVDQAANGEQALQQLAVQPGYDLVLTDVVMPGTVSGLDIYARIHQDYPHTRVLCMTGYSEDMQGRVAEELAAAQAFPASAAGSQTTGTVETRVCLNSVIAC